MRLINGDALYRKVKRECNPYGKPTIDYESGNRVLDLIDSQPTIQPEPHWIPVTERLPEEDQPVLITDGAVMWVCSLVRTDDGYKWESNMGYWHDFDEWKAWMPLPEPYKGVAE